jgi:CheY-like chemotaxis protein
LDGITATQLILKKRPDVDVIYMTADATDETRAKCEASGAVRLLLKPVKKTLLISTLSSVLEERRAMLVRRNPEAARSFGSSMNVCCLIVDDSQTNRVFLGHLVKKLFARCDLVFAESGEAAVIQAAECSPDLILMDVRMPGGMNGVEATRKIREKLSSVPIVGVTGANDGTTLRECMEAGMTNMFLLSR